jgi:tetratricopeptide (TPR) repeat protein
MLETLREYALERLRTSADDVPTRRAHAVYCIVIAEEGNPLLTTAERNRWLSRCDAEADNFRAALDWLIETRNAEWALRLALALFAYWERREHIAEGRQRLEAVLGLVDAADRTRDWARAASYAASLAFVQGGTTDPGALHREALDVFRALADRRGVASALNSLGVHRQFLGDHAAAREYFAEALAACRSIGEPSEIAATLSNLARAASIDGDAAQARSLLDEARDIFSSLGDDVAVAWCVGARGDISRREGDAREARRLYADALERFTCLGDQWGIARSSSDLAHAVCDEGDHPEARRLLTLALKTFVALDHKRGIARVLEGFAYLAQSDRHFARALTLAGAAAAFREASGTAARPFEQAAVEQSLEPARRSCGRNTAQRLWTAGRQMPLERGLEYALEDSDDVTRRS